MADSLFKCTKCGYLGARMRLVNDEWLCIVRCAPPKKIDSDTVDPWNPHEAQVKRNYKF